jgi:gliding motility-associated-like protein
MHRLLKYCLIVSLFLTETLIYAQKLVHPEVQNTIRFTENKKQWESHILYRAFLDGGSMFLEKDGFTYNFYNQDALHHNHVLKAGKEPLPINSHAFKVWFKNAKPSVKTVSKQVTPDYCNFFIGKDKSKWAGNVKNYKEVVYDELYDGINLQIIGMQNSLKYNFYVAPMATTDNIQLEYEGVEQIYLEKGALKIKTSINEITEQNPYAYQWIDGRKVEVPCDFKLEGTTVSFDFPRGYDKKYELVIDPILVFACSSGSTADNFGMTATYDAQGNLYSGGTCFAQGFPTTLGAFDVTFNGIVTTSRTDVVITKYDSSGTFLQYSTYLGGASSTEVVSSIIVNAQDELMLYGVTGSNDFPMGPNAYDSTFAGGTFLNYAPNGTQYNNGLDLYVAKFNPTGTALLASTYIGGTQNDGVNSSATLVYNYGDYYRGEIQVDPFGNCYIASCSFSADFPTTAGVAQPTKSGGLDGVVFKFDSNLSTLLWSTFIGGTSDDACYAVTIDDSLDVYATGGTASANFPVTVGAISTTYNGGITDGFVSKLKNDGTSILNSTFIGTPAYDQSFFIQLDKDFDVYIVGQTLGVMPVSGGVYSNANSGQFIWKMTNDLSAQIFTTIFGNGNNSINISPSAFLVDYCENIYVSGWGGHILQGVPTNNMPLTANAIQTTTDGFNFYLFVLSTNATSLLYATYFGGAISQEHVDGGTSRFDKKGIIYQSVCAGCQNNDDFPVTPGSWPYTAPNYTPLNPAISSTGINMSTNCNNGTFKFDFQVAIADANFTVDYLEGCAPLTVEFENQSTGGTYLWNFGNNDTTSTVFNPIRTYPTPGTYLVELYIFNPASCNIWDTAFQYVTVHPAITADFDLVSTPCSNQVAFNDSSSVAPVSWLWYFDDGDSSVVQNPIHVYDTSGVYDVQLIATNTFGCKDTTLVQVEINLATTNISPNDTICFQSNGTQLLASGGFAYSWSPSTGLSNTTIPNPNANPPATTTYTVSISTTNAAGDTCIQTQTTTVYVINPTSFSLVASADNDTITEGESTIIHAVSTPTVPVIWQNGGFTNPNLNNQTVSPTETTTYYVSILDSTGCPRVTSITVYVLNMKCRTEDVFVPNTFTPNGDGQNDVLFVRGNVIQELYFAVYNRWGEMVFETTDFTKGWDGVYKGMKADPAVFAWYLRVKCYNGEELKKKGNTTLIR